MGETVEVSRRVSKLFADSVAASQGTELMKLWRDNYRATADLTGKTLQRFLLLALLFTLLATARLTEVSVFGLKFKELDVPLGLAYVACGFLFYRVLSLFSFSQLLETALDYSYQRVFSPWHAAGLTRLTQHPGVTNLESSLGGLETHPTWFLRFSTWWAAAVAICVLVVCLAWFAWAGTVIVREVPIGFALIVLTFSALCVTRGVLFGLHVLYRT